MPDTAYHAHPAGIAEPAPNTYLRIKAESAHKTPSELVAEMVQERIAALA